MEIGKTVTGRSRAEWRRWLARHHADHQEIWLRYNKKTSGKSGITYEESVEEALCYGWIDGQLKSIDDMTYAIRFTPRRPGGNWSASNLARVKRLIVDGRMSEAGLKVIPTDVRAPA